MPAPRHDTAGLLARIRAKQAEIDVLDASRAERAAEVKRLINQLAKLPSDEPEAASLPAPAPIPIKDGHRRSGKSIDTLRRRGGPAGWAWKVGGRWVVDPVRLDAWMRGTHGRA